MPVAYADLNALVTRLQTVQTQAPVMAQSVLEESAERIADLMREKVPIRTGRLFMSIRVESEPGIVRVGPHTEYALYVEYGTRKMRAQPYIRPAARQWAAEVNKAMSERAVKLIETGRPK